MTYFDCSTEGRKAYVGTLMKDFYLWYQEIPEPFDYESAGSPQEVMAHMRFRERDRWSGMQEIVERRAYFDRGEYLGLGYTLGRDAEGNLRVSWSHEGSAAGRANLDRGTILQTINGREVADLTLEELGQELAQDVVTHTVIDTDGTVRDVELERAEVQITSVKGATVLDTDSGPVGYFMFTSFVLPGENELREVFRTFREQDVEQLVVDLRYNGGGLLQTAALLGSLIRSEAAGQPLIVETYNDKHLDWNRSRLLYEAENALNVSHVVFLTTGRTASASEQVINGLRPYMQVDVVGERTLGKPVGSDSWEHCGYAIVPVTFRSLNAEAEGNYFNGIAPTCAARDDLTHGLGDPEEAQLAAALRLLEGAGCEEDMNPEEDSAGAPALQKRGLGSRGWSYPGLLPGFSPDAPGRY